MAAEEKCLCAFERERRIFMYKYLSCPVLFQAANAFQQKLESEVSIFLSMVKNEENSGRSP